MTKRGAIISVKARVGNYIAETRARSVNSALRKIFKTMLNEGLIKKQPKTDPSYTSSYEDVDIISIKKVD
ncbi:MAG: hypothetical protein KatS3mg087_1400 [Patescibacteria group bacterium]|nr:MAG: hypothetical protein KatS3mg087_1400 [Patescibacteria group bacterium]